MNWAEVKAWRKQARQKLLAARSAIAVPVREDLSRRMIERLRPLLKTRSGPVSFYWPIKAEPDLKPLMRELDAEGIDVCLPVCIKLGEPLRFRRWTHGARMERGFWDIPVPADPAEVEPRTLIAPIVGYDGRGYRLGYGGGFFDRTLAMLGDAEAIGIGWSLFRLATIHPQSHDISMAAIVTERETVSAESAPPSSAVCYADEAPDDYSGFASIDEIASVLFDLRSALPPERQGLADYALWQLGKSGIATTSGAEPRQAALQALLPRIRDDALHATLTALLASTEA